MSPGVAFVPQSFVTPNEDVEEGALFGPAQATGATSDIFMGASISGVGSELMVAFSTKEIMRGPGPQIRLRQERSKAIE